MAPSSEDRLVSRRGFLAGASLVPLAAALGPDLLAKARAATGRYVFFDDHRGAVVREATARLIPGPFDDPLEAGHPGAREANVVRYIDVLLGAFRVPAGAAPKIHAGGPWSDRHGGATDAVAEFVPLSRVQEHTWRRRIAGLQRTYREGVWLLDRLSPAGDFAAAAPSKQDAVLAGADAQAFSAVLFRHAIEGMYSLPEYGGNANLAGWTEIAFPGDVQPRGYTRGEVARSDGSDPAPVDSAVAHVMARFDELAPTIAARWRGGR